MISGVGQRSDPDMRRRIDEKLRGLHFLDMVGPIPLVRLKKDVMISLQNEEVEKI